MIGVEILVGDASRGSRAAHEAEIDARLARLQAHAGEASGFSPEGAARPCALEGAARRRWRDRRRRGVSAARRDGRRDGSGLTLGGGAASCLRQRDFGAAARQRIRQARRVDANELGADSQHVPDRAAEREHAARDGRWNFDGRLVGHHGGDDLILPDEIADLDRPFDDLGFRDALADVGHLDRAHAHLRPPSP